jgi:hypothetical protein
MRHIHKNRGNVADCRELGTTGVHSFASSGSLLAQISYSCSLRDLPPIAISGRDRLTQCSGSTSRLAQPPQHLLTSILNQDSISFGIGISSSRRFAIVAVRSSWFLRRCCRKAVQLEMSCNFCSTNTARSSSCAFGDKREYFSSKLLIIP